MARVRECCGIAFMRANNAKFDPRLRTAVRTPPAFVRRGESGVWERELDDSVKEKLVEELRRTADALDGDAGPFEEAFDLAPS